MPELPEVETIIRDLRPQVLGRRFVGATFEWPRLVQNLAQDEFNQRIAGQEILGLERRGKYIIFGLPGEKLIMHLMMSGSLRIRRSDSDPDKYLSANFYLDDGNRLSFCDSRKLGRVWLVDSDAAVVNGMGPEPLLEDFTVDYLAEKLRGRRAPIKPLLLNQATVAGLGNIYVDETLYAAGIRPDRIAGDLTKAEISRIWQAARDVLTRGIANRGTTFRDYKDGFGNAGDNQNALQVFRREGQPCYSCGATIPRIVLRGRSTFFCPECQK